MRDREDETNVVRPTFGRALMEEVTGGTTPTPLQDEEDYVQTDREDLVARLMGAQHFAAFLLRACDVLKNHGVYFKNLPAWKGVDEMFRKARRLRPTVAQVVIVSFFERLNHDLTAAIRRNDFKVTDNTKEASKPLDFALNELKD